MWGRPVSLTCPNYQAQFLNLSASYRDGNCFCLACHRVHRQALGGSIRLIASQQLRATMPNGAGLSLLILAAIALNAFLLSVGWLLAQCLGCKLFVRRVAGNSVIKRYWKAGCKGQRRLE